MIAHIGRTRLKVGIRAPRATTVIPHEVKLIREQNRAAARVQGPSGATLSSLLARLRPPDHEA